MSQIIYSLHVWQVMTHPMIFLLGALLMPDTTVGQELNRFLDKYEGAIQNFVMTGHEEGWKLGFLSDKRASERASPHLLRTANRDMPWSSS